MTRMNAKAPTPDSAVKGASDDASHAGTAVVDLREVDANSGELVGGKAANLGELIGAGFSVPPGFCVTTTAYERVAATAGMEEKLAELPSESAAAKLAAWAGGVRATLETATMPDDVAAAISAAYQKLDPTGRCPVAVRSSATAEDLPSASFAGQQDTYLNIVGADALLDAVRRCWASLWTERATAYRASNGIDHRSVRLAVVVQRMVDARVAGVMFTADPMTGNRDQTVIDASPGLGEAVVSGQVTPDHFRVDSATKEIISRRAGDRAVVISAKKGGGTSAENRPISTAEDGATDGDREFCLTDDQVAALTELGHRVAEHYGRPQDTEWAIDDDGMLWLTQARPITTLYPLPHCESDDPRVYFSVNVAQGVNQPMTPMGISGMRRMAGSAARTLGFDIPADGPPILVSAGARLFIDLTAAVRSKAGRAIVPKVLSQGEARSGPLIQRIFDDERFSLRYDWRPFLRGIARAAVKSRAPLRLAEALITPEVAIRRAFRLLGEVRQLGAGPDEATALERLDFLADMPSRVLAPRIVPIMPVVFPGLIAVAMLPRLLGSVATADEIHAILRSVPHNVTTEMDLELWRMARRCADDVQSRELLASTEPAELAKRYLAGELPAVFSAELADFLREYGHRAIAEIDLGVPRWSDDPTHIIGVVANYARLSDLDRAPDRLFAAGAVAADEMVETLTARLATTSRARARIGRFAMRRVRQLAGLRELPKFFFVTGLGQFRRQLVKVGAELADRGMIARPEDIFFLTLEQAREGAHGRDVRAEVVAAREEFERESVRSRVPRFLLSDGTDLEAVPVSATSAELTGAPDGALVGMPASAGTVTGIARVITDPAGAYLEPGEILVAPSTDPGWTPLFLTAGALVMEMGGASSHGSIVAREYGIPAVVGVPGAVAAIRTGQRITVDGAAGIVTIEDEPRDEGES